MRRNVDTLEAPRVTVPHEHLKPAPFARRCPKCGHVIHSDSGIAGTCEYCPGLVPLRAG